MSEAIKAALSTPLSLSQGNSNSECPTDIQYMPPGTHRINASRKGQPVSLDITIDASTAETLNSFLQAQLTQATEGTEDRPFFDFNHEDREAAAWPTEFYWAGDDLKTGGVRAKVDWSGAGEKAVTEKTFRRFSPTFIPDEQGRVIGSETNMGGLVNRAAFKRIQPLFAKSSGTQVSRPASCEYGNSTSDMKPIQAKLLELKIIDSVEASDDSIALAVDAKFHQLETENRELKNRIEAQVKARAENLINDAITAGRIAPNDATKAFWRDALLRDEATAVQAIEALPVNPVLAKVTQEDAGKSGVKSRMQLQQAKLAEVQAAHPQADFQTIFAKAKSLSPDLFN